MWDGFGFQDQDILASMSKALEILYREPPPFDESEWAYKKQVIENYRKSRGIEEPEPAPWPTVAIPQSAIVGHQPMVSKRARRRNRKK